MEDAVSAIVGLVLVVFFIGITGAAYFFPTLVAYLRKHPQTLAIGLLNLFLGWTFLGWVAALIWSVTESKTND